MSALTDRIDAARRGLRRAGQGAARPGDALVPQAEGARRQARGDASKKIVATKEGGAITGEERIREHLDLLYGAVNGWEGARRGTSSSASTCCAASSPRCKRHSRRSPPVTSARWRARFASENFYPSRPPRRAGRRRTSTRAALCGRAPLYGPAGRMQRAAGGGGDRATSTPLKAKPDRRLVECWPKHVRHTFFAAHAGPVHCAIGGRRPPYDACARCRRPEAATN